LSEIDRTLAKELVSTSCSRGPSSEASPRRATSIPSVETPWPRFSLRRHVTSLRHQAGLQDFAVFMRALDDKGGLKILAEPTSWSPTARREIPGGRGVPHRHQHGDRGTAAYSVTYKNSSIRLNFPAKDFSNERYTFTVSQEVERTRLPPTPSRFRGSGSRLEDPQAKSGSSWRTARPLYWRAPRQQGVEAGHQVPPPRRYPYTWALFRSTRYQNNEPSDGDVSRRSSRPLNKDEIPALPRRR